MQKITFISHGYRLGGHLFTPNAPKNLAFLLIQGWTGSQNLDLAAALSDLGYTSLIYDMRGNKSSQGDITKFSRADFRDDAAAAYDLLGTHLGPRTAIGVIGSSFGSDTAALLSAQRPVQCLSLRVPASFPDDGFSQAQQAQIDAGVLSATGHQVLDHSQNYALSAIHAFSGNIQIVEADHDETIPHQMVQNYVNAVSDPSKLDYALLRDAPHRLANDRLRAEYIELVTKWVKQQ